MFFDSVFDMDFDDVDSWLGVDDLGFDPIDHVQEMEDWLEDPEFDQLESEYHDSLYGA